MESEARRTRHGYARGEDAMNHLRERLLVVDGAGTKATLAGYLDRIGYRARFASSGGQALSMLREGLPADAVVYDANLPAMDGDAFVRQLRADGNLTPVLLMTKPFKLLDFGDTLLRLLADRSRAGTTRRSGSIQ
jgi:CheY-like chemotaxis protein